MDNLTTYFQFVFSPHFVQRVFSGLCFTLSKLASLDAVDYCDRVLLLDENDRAAKVGKIRGKLKRRLILFSLYFFLSLPHQSLYLIYCAVLLASKKFEETIRETRQLLEHGQDEFYEELREMNSKAEVRMISWNVFFYERGFENHRIFLLHIFIFCRPAIANPRSRITTQFLASIGTSTPMIRSSRRRTGGSPSSSTPTNKLEKAPPRWRRRRVVSAKSLKRMKF